MINNMFVWLWLVVNDRKFPAGTVFFSHTNQPAVLLHEPATKRTSQPNRLNSHRPKTVCVHFPNPNTPGHLYFGLASHKTTTSWLVFLIHGQSGVFAKFVMLGMNLLGLWIFFLFFFSNTQINLEKKQLRAHPWQETENDHNSSELPNTTH